MEGQSREELLANLAEYRTQIKQVEELLLSEPNNEEYADIYNSLREVIDITQELLRETPAEGAQQPQAPRQTGSRWGEVKPVTAAAPQGPALVLPSILPPQVAQQIRAAQIKAALSGQAPANWAIGAKCQAMYSADGEYYDATVTGVSSTGNFVVSFDAYGMSEEVPRDNVRPPSDQQEFYTGVAAPKRKRVEEEPTVAEMPAWLEIREGDDDKTRAKKKKLQKSYKSKLRFQQMDMETKKRQDSWLNFRKGKGAKKKTGFLTGTKKTSIFAVPDDPNAKVGVIGSGKGITEFQMRGRHDFGPADEDG